MSLGTVGVEQTSFVLSFADGGAFVSSSSSHGGRSLQLANALKCET